NAVMAVGDQGRAGRGLKLGEPARQLAQRNEHAARQSGQGMLPGLTHVNQEQRSAGGDMPGQFLDGDFSRHGARSNYFSFSFSFFSSIGSLTGWMKCVLRLSVVSLAACSSASLRRGYS